MFRVVTERREGAGAYELFLWGGHNLKHLCPAQLAIRCDPPEKKPFLKKLLIPFLTIRSIHTYNANMHITSVNELFMKFSKVIS